MDKMSNINTINLGSNYTISWLYRIIAKLIYIYDHKVSANDIGWLFRQPPVVQNLREVNVDSVMTCADEAPYASSWL